MEKPQIFLCHASEDKAAVYEVYKRLKEEGFKPWLDKEDLLPGQIWMDEIPKAIKSSDFVLVFLSNSSTSKRGYVQKEFKIVLDVLDEIPEGRTFVIPVKLDDCEVPSRFQHLHWSNLYEPNGLDKVITSIRLYVEQINRKRSALEAASDSLEDSIDQAEKSIGTLESKLFEIPVAYDLKYQSFLKEKNTGIIKLLPFRKYEKQVSTIQGGAWYSFSLCSHDAFNEADLAFNEHNDLETGFKGLDFGFFLNLGDVPIQRISNSRNYPLRLGLGYRDAWNFVWKYKPPAEVKKARLEGYKFSTYSGWKIGKARLRSHVEVVENTTFLLRSVNYESSDLLVALRIEEIQEDGSIVLVWKILKNFVVPTASGPEPYPFPLVIADSLARELRGYSIQESYNFDEIKLNSIESEIFLEIADGISFSSGWPENIKQLLSIQEKGLIIIWPELKKPKDFSPEEKYHAMITTKGLQFNNQDN